MKTATLVAAALMALGATAGSATAWISDGNEVTYDMNLEMDGRGYAGIFFSMPVATDGSGMLQMKDNGVSKTLRTFEDTPLDIVATFNGNEVRGAVHLDAENLQWNGNGWDVDISLAEGSVNGLKDLQLTGSMTERGESKYDVDLSGYAIYNMQRVSLSLDGVLGLSEFTGPQVM